MEQPIISGIAFTRDEAKLTVLGVQDVPGVASAILGPISHANIEVDMIVRICLHGGMYSSKNLASTVDIRGTRNLAKSSLELHIGTSSSE